MDYRKKMSKLARGQSQDQATVASLQSHCRAMDSLSRWIIELLATPRSQTRLKAGDYVPKVRVVEPRVWDGKGWTLDMVEVLFLDKNLYNFLLSQRIVKIKYAFIIIDIQLQLLRTRRKSASQWLKRNRWRQIDGETRRGVGPGGQVWTRLLAQLPSSSTIRAFWWIVFSGRQHFVGQEKTSLY